MRSAVPQEKQAHRPARSVMTESGHGLFCVIPYLSWGGGAVSAAQDELPRAATWLTATNFCDPYLFGQLALFMLLCRLAATLRSLMFKVYGR